MQQTLSLLAFIFAVAEFADHPEPIAGFDDDQETPGTIPAFLRRHSDGSPEAIYVRVKPADSDHPAGDFNPATMLQKLAFDKCYDFTYGRGVVCVSRESARAVH
jgi:hypothetical protein